MAMALRLLKCLFWKCGMKYVGENIYGLGFILKILQLKKKRRKMRNRWKTVAKFWKKIAELGLGAIFSVAVYVWNLTINKYLMERKLTPTSHVFCEDSTNTHKALAGCLAHSRASQPQHHQPVGPAAPSGRGTASVVQDAGQHPWLLSPQSWQPKISPDICPWARTTAPE